MYFYNINIKYSSNRLVFNEIYETYTTTCPFSSECEDTLFHQKRQTTV